MSIDLSQLAEAAWEHLRETYAIWDAYNDRDMGAFKDQSPEVQAALIEALVKSVSGNAQSLAWNDAT